MESPKLNALRNLKKSSKSCDELGLRAKMMKPMQKVTVAAQNPKDLEKGLSMAQEIMKKRQAMMGKPEVEEDSVLGQQKQMEELESAAMEKMAESEEESEAEEIAENSESEESEQPETLEDLRERIAELERALASK